MSFSGADRRPIGEAEAGQKDRGGGGGGRGGEKKEGGRGSGMSEGGIAGGMMDGSEKSCPFFPL